MGGLKSVKVGDTLATDGYGREVILRKVIAVGKLHATTEDGSKWQISSGRRAGSGDTWSTKYARIATASDLMRVRIYRVQESIRHVIVDEGNIELVEAFLTSIKKGGGQ